MWDEIGMTLSQTSFPFPFSLYSRMFIVPVWRLPLCHHSRIMKGEANKKIRINVSDDFKIINITMETGAATEASLSIFSGGDTVYLEYTMLEYTHLCELITSDATS